MREPNRLFDDTTNIQTGDALKHFGFLLISLTLILGPIASPIANSATQGVTDTEVKIGAHSILSGPQAAYGVITEVQAAYYKMINEQGGIHGRKINFVYGDSAFEMPKALEITKKLIGVDKVFAMVGSIGEVNSATYKYIESKGIPDLFMADNSSFYTEKFAKTRFAISPSWKNEGESMGKFIAERFPGKRIGFIYWNADFAKECVTALKNAMKGKVTFGLEQTAEYDAVNLDAQVLNLKKDKVDVIWLGVDIPHSSMAVKFGTQNGFKPQWFVSSYNVNSAFVDVGGKANMDGVTGSWYLQMPDVKSEGMKKHLDLLKKYLPKVTADPLTVYGQWNAELFVEILKRTGRNLTKDSFLKAAEGFKDWKCSVCIEPHNTSATDHRFVETLHQYTVKNGVWVPIEDKK